MSNSSNKRKTEDSQSSSSKKAVTVPARPGFTWAKRSVTDNVNTVEIGRFSILESGETEKDEEVTKAETSSRSSEKLATFTASSILAHAGISGFENDEDWSTVSARVLESIRKCHEEGFKVIFFDNGIDPSTGKGIGSVLKKTLPRLANLLQIPIQVFFATRIDFYAKPSPGMFTRLKERLETDPNLEESFIVGDQRPEVENDRKLAINLGIQFHTTSEYFDDAISPSTSKLSGFDFKDYNHELPLTSPVDAIIYTENHPVEVVVFVGYPGSGKSTFYRNHFEVNGYVWVNQDTLKTRPKCIALVKASLIKKTSVVVDNTNRGIATRKLYLDFKETYPAVKFRCFNFVSENDQVEAVSLAKQSATYRALQGGSNLPLVAFNTFTSNYEKPTLAEGFDEVIEVNFRFEGSVAEKKIWSQWLL